MFFGGLARFFEGVSGVLVRLAGEFVGSEAALAMRGGGSGVGMCGKVVIFSGSIVWALGHWVILSGLDAM